jgi:hypothetical protein
MQPGVTNFAVFASYLLEGIKLLTAANESEKVFSL